MVVKNVVLMALLVFGGTCCSPWQNTGSENDEPNMFMGQVAENEYEVQIIDHGFKKWFTANARPVNFYTQEYYELINDRYARAWNEKVASKRFGSINSPFQSRIDYDPTIDYGLEIDYILFYYFKYIEHRYGHQYKFPG